MPGVDPWDPARYGQFRDERAQPFFDLLDLLSPVPGGRAVDLGCGTGELTAILHGRLQVAETIGIDASEAMLAASEANTAEGLTFLHGDIASFTPDRPFDVVFSNAALQWVPGHDRLIPRLIAMLAPGGQLAIQIPFNHGHPSHVAAREVAAEEPFHSAFTGPTGYADVYEPEWYATMLHRAGFDVRDARLQVYLHELAGLDELVDWVRGTLLTDYRRRLPANLYEEFEARYRDRLAVEIGDEEPYLFTFRRLLVHTRAPDAATG